jgi:hypothetical protein
MNCKGVKKKPGNRKTGAPVSVPVWKNQKPGTPVPVPGFWYPVFTGLPRTGLNIYILIVFLVRALHFSFLVCLHICFYFLLF